MKTIQVRFPDRIHGRLKALAKEEGVSPVVIIVFSINVGGVISLPWAGRHWRSARRAGAARRAAAAARRRLPRG